MNEWHDLFVATAGAAAALTGLIFVGVSINLTRILSFKHLPNRALISLLLLLTILIVSILMLMPSTSLWANGAEALTVTMLLWIAISIMDENIYRTTQKEYKQLYISHIAANQLCILLYLIAGVLLLMSKPGGYYCLTLAFIACFIKSIWDAWVLLVEINR